MHVHSLSKSQITDICSYMLSAKISILIVYLLCFCSVDSLSVVDLGAGVKHRKVVSLAEGTEKVSSLEVIIEFSMTVYL